MKILFMGTPEIAAESLKKLIEENRHEICGVFTREDKPVGRKKIMTAPPVKIVAQENNIPVFQPKTLRNEEEYQTIKNLNPDIIVVVAYGRILPQAILDLPKFGAINLHVSLLPKYRGAAPIQWAVINGDKKTGVSIMQLDAGLDTGDVIDCLPVEIGENITSGELMQEVSKVGAVFLCETILKIENGNATKTKQDNQKASHAPPLEKNMALFTFDEYATKLHNLIRGMNPWPMAYFMQGDKKIKVSKSELVKDSLAQDKLNDECNNDSERTGEVLSLKPLTIACKNGAIVLHELIPEGSKPMTGTAHAAGKRLAIGDKII